VGQRLPQRPWPSAPGVKTCPQVGEAASSGERQRPSPHPSGSSIFSNSERLKLRESQPCRTGSAALWAAYKPKEPRPPDAGEQTVLLKETFVIQCLHQDVAYSL